MLLKAFDFMNYSACCCGNYCFIHVYINKYIFICFFIFWTGENCIKKVMERLHASSIFLYILDSSFDCTVRFLYLLVNLDEYLILLS